MASLQDQLLKVGIVDKDKAKKIKAEQRKASRSKPKGQTRVDETLDQARRTLAAKAERDRELNRQRQAAAEEKSVRAQIIQLITMNKIDRGRGEVPFQFTDGSRIKKLFVTPALQEDLVRGRVAIARLDEGYQLLPATAARKIMERDANTVVLLNEGGPEVVDEDDPYAQYQIPDDLMW